MFTYELATLFLYFFMNQVITCRIMLGVVFFKRTPFYIGKFIKNGP